MRYVWIGLAAIVGLVVVGFVLLVVNVIVRTGRERKRVAAKLRPVTDAIAAGGDPDPGAVRALAADPETRNALYDALEGAGKQGFFPEEFRTREKFAESDLVCWLAHPNELRGAPDEIRLMKAVTVEAAGGGPVEWYCFQFRTNEPHWAAKRGWMVGASGPYLKDGAAVPKERPGGTWSELEAVGGKGAEAWVNGFHERAGGVVEEGRS
jgi:hypothetical protein